MKELWIGVVEVLTEASIGSGNTRALTNVVTWAESVSDFSSTVAGFFSNHGWTVLGIKNARTVASESGFKDEIAEIIERARTDPNACIFATFHYYPSKPS